MIIVQVCYIISEVTDILHVVFATGIPSYICPEHAYVTSSGEDTYKRSWNKGISIHKQDFLLSFPYMNITKRLWDDKNLMFNFEAFENLNGADGGISDQIIMVVMHKSVWYSVPLSNMWRHSFHWSVHYTTSAFRFEESTQYDIAVNTRTVLAILPQQGCEAILIEILQRMISGPLQDDTSNAVFSSVKDHTTNLNKPLESSN